MLWVMLTFVAILLLTGAILIDKFIITKEVKDPFLTTVISGAVIFFSLVVVSLPFSKELMSPTHIAYGLAAGVVYVVVLWFYYFTLSREEVSRAVPAFSTTPLFVLPFGFFFFGEAFTALKYVGVVMVVLGAVLLSFRKALHRVELDKMILLGLLTAFLFGFRSVLVKFATLEAGIWSVLPWIGLGGVSSASILFAFHHPRIVKKAKQGIGLLILTGVLTGLGVVFLFTAISVGPVSLVMALFGIRPFFVGLMATGLSVYYPRFIHEEITLGILIQKMIATVLVVIGGAFIVL